MLGLFSLRLDDGVRLFNELVSIINSGSRNRNMHLKISYVVSDRSVYFESSMQANLQNSFAPESPIIAGGRR